MQPDGRGCRPEKRGRNAAGKRLPATRRRALAALDLGLVAGGARRADALVIELVALLRFVLDAAVGGEMAPLPAERPERRRMWHEEDFAGHALLYPFARTLNVAAPGALVWPVLLRRAMHRYVVPCRRTHSGCVTALPPQTAQYSSPRCSTLKLTTFSGSTPCTLRALCSEASPSKFSP